jgi:hypothetical protein
VGLFFTVVYQGATVIDSTSHRLDATRVYVGAKVVKGLNRHTTSGTRRPTVHVTVVGLFFTVVYQGATVIDSTSHRLDATDVLVQQPVSCVFKDFGTHTATWKIMLFNVVLFFCIRFCPD